MTEDAIRENAVMATPFVDALLKQPSALRDVISLVLVLVHGRTGNRWGSTRVRATITRIEAVSSSVTPDELKHRPLSLEHDGLLSIEDDDGLWYFDLVDPTADSVGWDLFVAIHKLAAGNADVIRRIIDDLDFSVMDA